MDRIKTLIHIHTDYSYDSDISLETLAGLLADEQFGCVAVTDHDTLDGARGLRNMTDANVVVGEEVTTRDGHVIGLFLEEHVRPGMSARDTARAIRDQGGLVFLPHPFVKLLGCGVCDVAWQLIDLIDAVEVNNAQNLLAGPDRAAERFAEQTGLPKYVGSDSHMKMSLAPCYQHIRSFDGPADFLDAITTAELITGTHPLSFFAATGYRLVRSCLGLPLGGEFGVNVPATPPVSLARPSRAAVA